MNYAECCALTQRVLLLANIYLPYATTLNTWFKTSPCDCERFHISIPFHQVNKRPHYYCLPSTSDSGSKLDPLPSSCGKSRPHHPPLGSVCKQPACDPEVRLGGLLLPVQEYSHSCHRTEQSADQEALWNLLSVDCDSFLSFLDSDLAPKRYNVMRDGRFQNEMRFSGVDGCISYESPRRNKMEGWLGLWP